MKEKTINKAKEICLKIIRDITLNKEVSFTKIFTLLQNRYDMETINKALEELKVEGKIQSRITNTSSDKDIKDTWYRLC